MVEIKENEQSAQEEKHKDPERMQTSITNWRDAIYQRL
jgi:hypothetical protein